jgi:glucose-6-phosphate dehydrogenase assembly protein OpcA
VAGELVRIDARGSQLDRVPAIVRASLEPDVATTLWWTGPVAPKAPYVTALRDLADRVIVDTEALPDDADVEHLLPPSGSGRLADLAWPRLAPWRIAIARAFDAPRHRAFLAEIAEVRIGLGTHGATAPDASAAPLLAGWLAAALGWPTCVRSVGPGSVRAACFAGDRSVAMSIVPHDSPREGVVAVDLVTATGAALRFRRTNTGFVDIETPPGFAPVRAPVFRELDAADVLGATLLELWADPIAPASIRRAAEIAAALGTG